MDKKLQNFLLQLVKENGGVVERRDIRTLSIRDYYRDCKVQDISAEIKHQLDLLEEDKKVVRTEEMAGYNTLYRLTRLGHQALDSFWKRAGRFILYDKHNLYFMVSLFISIIALVISILD